MNNTVIWLLLLLTKDNVQSKNVHLNKSLFCFANAAAKAQNQVFTEYPDDNALDPA